MRPRIVLASVFLLLFAAVPWTAFAADEEPKAQFSGLVEVSEVLLDVLVTDRKGRVIVGLGPEDFLVEDNGREVALNSTSFYSNRFEVRDDDPSRIQKPAANEVLADRYFIFLFDDQKLRADSAHQLLRRQIEAGRQTRRWIQQEMLPGDWVAIASYDVKLKVHQDFTRNRELLLRAVDFAVQGKDPENIWGSRRPETPEGQPTLLKHLPEGKALRDETTKEYDAFRLLADATHDIVGRKNLVFFSTGFGRMDTPIAQVGALPDDRYFPAMRASLNDNNVAVYSVDLTPGGWISGQSSFLTHLSVETGGEYYGTFTNFITPLRQIADEANGYYLLSYQAEHPAGESGYREVTVKVRNPDFKVKARRGYSFGS